MTNPNGANQYVLDPRQKLCWDSYVNPKSETFGNAYQSAQKAGYEESYAATIYDTEWFREKVRRMNMLNRSEKNLQEVQELQIKDDEGKLIPDALRERNKIDMFIAERLGKNEGYSTRSELTGADGKDLPTPILQGLNTKEDAD